MMTTTMKMTMMTMRNTKQKVELPSCFSNAMKIEVYKNRKTTKKKPLHVVYKERCLRPWTWSRNDLEKVSRA